MSCHAGDTECNCLMCALKAGVSNKQQGGGHRCDGSCQKRMVPLTEKQAEYLATYVTHQNQFPKLMNNEVMEKVCSQKLDPHLGNAIMCVLKERKSSKTVPLLSEIVGAPWKIPRTLPGARKINYLLERNMAYQMDSLPGTEFEDCFLSGDSLGVCSQLFMGLKSIGVQSHFNVGLLRVGDKALPMVWLTIHGTLIDNTYHHWPGMDKKEIESRLRSAKTIEHYIEEDPTTTKWPLIDQLGSKSCLSDPRLLEAFAKPEKIGQYIGFRIGQPTVYPNFSLYSYAFLLDSATKSQATVRGKEITGPYNDARNCWFCKKESKSLKKCQTCGAGLYCDTKCQKADWADHKLLHKDRETNRLFQEELARRRRQD